MMKLITTLTLLIFTQAYAGSMQFYGNKMNLIPFGSAPSKTPTIGLQTFHGQNIDVGQVIGGRPNMAMPLNKIVQNGLIELKTGDIYYGEEMRFVVSPRMGEFTGASSRGGFILPNGRAPHTPK